MSNPDPLRLLDKLLFTTIRMYGYQGKTGDVLRKKTLHTYALCSVTRGKGILTINGSLYQVGKGDLFVLLPGMIIEGKSHSVEPIQYTLILFSCVQLSRHKSDWRVEQPDLLVQGRLTVSCDAPPIKGLLDQLMDLNKSRLAQDKAAMKYMLSRLLLLVIQMEDRQEEKQDEVGMERALGYMNENYMKDIKIDQLARMAGFSTNHFTKSFKHQMNMTPTEYLLKQRIARAKQLLFASGKMKEVAQQVGYKDEHYFSRVFKKAEGVAPTFYVKNKCHRIATLYYGLDDHLITLGLKPVAALSYAERVSHMYPVPVLSKHNQEGLLLDSFKPNYEKLMRTKPDLMLTSDRLEQDEALNQIAPTTVLKHSNHYGSMLEHIAKILGREQQAAVWMDKYAECRGTLKEKISARWGKQTAIFIRVRPNFYRIYGSLNQTGYLLYDDLGLTLPSGFPEQEWAVDIRLNDLHLFNPNHIFLMADPTEAARKRLQELLYSEQWAALDAVRHHRVYDASDLLFKTLGPTGRMWAMKHAAAQLGI
ncbi:AraC family transcriptional regulator [Paenibacillus eucommiae]|uniref:ABC-type Fe3+-hydroxamate transport system substrate-binding protein n=1 Tax=Paenibacillus eucommiae TaxID=1355755 RepID=A0ABS4JAV5_9BACL|nr:AraC family transcriptional regulator [Paenibacillus eucommiae]MBP1996982.1 ABC-type Fe3+-hydroxamate transport system substrate-binding protein [Paenibacillus eucommiae]